MSRAINLVLNLLIFDVVVLVNSLSVNNNTKITDIDTDFNKSTLSKIVTQNYKVESNGITPVVMWIDFRDIDTQMKGPCFNSSAMQACKRFAVSVVNQVGEQVKENLKTICCGFWKFKRCVDKAWSQTNCIQSDQKILFTTLMGGWKKTFTEMCARDDYYDGSPSCQFPLWAIVFIALSSIVFLTITTFLIYRFRHKIFHRRLSQ